MAITYKFSDALNVASRQLPRTIEDDLAAAICNLGMNIVWQAYDWRESIEALPPFYLIPNEQDHGSPAATVPDDFQGLRQTFMVQLTNTPVPYRNEIRVTKDLPLTHHRRLPHTIAFEPTNNSFRVFPRVPEGIGAADYLVDGKYKVRPAKVTAGNYTAMLLPFDDTYFDVMWKALRWAGLNIAGDPRAGQVQMTSTGGKQYTGALAEVVSGLDWMAGNEGLELGDPIIAPSEALAETRSFVGYSNVFGWVT